jgi:hypothetical protein
MRGESFPGDWGGLHNAERMESLNSIWICNQVEYDRVDRIRRCDAVRLNVVIQV